MELFKPSILLFFASIFSYNSVFTRAEAPSELQTYIVHVQHPEGVPPFSTREDRESWHRSFLPATAISDEPRLVYSYGSAMSGFAARLTPDEVKVMEKKAGFLQAYPDSLRPLATTHTPSFLGLHADRGVWRDSRFGEGMIIGVLDSGITPDHPSFRDDGTMPVPPPKWKGSCHLPAGATCNNKLIGARSFVTAANDSKIWSPVDVVGHGTHTASTAAGSFVKHASVLGNMNGTAVGMAPRAHLAVYRVCQFESCRDTDIVAGINAAIDDGVDVISMSLGGPPHGFYKDQLAIAAFGAAEKGIFVSCSAGNGGPRNRSVSNGAPWMLTVAAGSTDRTVRATVRLGDGREFYGQSLYQPANFSSESPLLLVRPDLAFCDTQRLNNTDVKGKMVVCLNTGVLTGINVANAGGAAMVLINIKSQGHTTSAYANVLPASNVDYADGQEIESYINTTKNPSATIVFEGTKIDRLLPAPAITSFSSRGPFTPSPGILKPDITGPGLDILAAWIGAPSAFEVVSGTSMSAPHLSGIAALIKSMHPDWSPAAIKSAIVTTSDVAGNDGSRIRDEQMNPAGYYAMGAGQVNPNRATDPGLVYDLAASDYMPYLCGLGYTDKQVSSIVRKKVRCFEVGVIPERELNYPSIVVPVGPNKAVEVSRTVTYVGNCSTTYTVEVEAPEAVLVSVRPARLEFSKVGERKRFTVRFSRTGWRNKGYTQGSLKWVSGAHVVTSPVVVNFVEE